MILRLDVRAYTRPCRFWQILQFQVTLDRTVHTVSHPAWIHSLRFEGIADCVRYARRAIFHYLERRLTEIPDQFEWHIYDEACVRLCPACQEPLHQTMQLRARLVAIDVSQWACAYCHTLAPPPQKRPRRTTTAPWTL
jgi:hypothetical protein